jgi:hypothetical protein
MRSRFTTWSWLAAAVVLLVPFLRMIHWYTGDSLYSNESEYRSLLEHAWWWLTEAGFGPWPGPLVVVLLPPALVLLSTLTFRATRARLVAAIVAAAAAWLIVLAAALEVGEDIIFSWIRMGLPLGLQALAVTAWAVLFALARPPRAADPPPPAASP